MKNLSGNSDIKISLISTNGHRKNQFHQSIADNHEKNANSAKNCRKKANFLQKSCKKCDFLKRLYEKHVFP